MTDFEIILIDKQGKLAQAWRTHFINTPIKIITGDILKVKTDAIVSPANSFGFMDGGIDALYTNYFGLDLQKRLQETIKEKYNGELCVGSAEIINTNKNPKWLICAPTMRTPQSISETTNSYLAFRAILFSIKKHNEISQDKINTIVCPGLGTGAGEMSTEKCARQMRIAYNNFINPSFPKSILDAQNIEDMIKY